MLLNVNKEVYLLSCMKTNLRLVVYEMNAVNNTKQILSAKEQDFIELTFNDSSVTFITNGVENCSKSNA